MFFLLFCEVLQSHSVVKTTWILKCPSMVEWNVVKHIPENNAQKNNTFLSEGEQSESQIHLPHCEADVRKQNATLWILIRCFACQRQYLQPPP